VHGKEHAALDSPVPARARSPAPAPHTRAATLSRPWLAPLAVDRSPARSRPLTRWTLQVVRREE